MNIKRLNEEMKKLLQMNELSSGLKQWAVDTRNSRYLAAQATADREKEKLNRTKKIQKNLEPKQKEEIVSSLEYIANNFVGTDFSDVREDNGNFYIVINDIDLEDGKLTKSAEEQLKDLLEEMSDRYGCKYSYRINGTKVEIICEKPNIIENDEEIFYAHFWDEPPYSGTDEIKDKPFEEANYKIILKGTHIKEIMTTHPIFEYYAFYRMSDDFFWVAGEDVYTLSASLMDDTWAWQVGTTGTSYKDINFEDAGISLSDSLKQQIEDDDLSESDVIEIIKAYEDTEEYVIYAIDIEPID